MSFQYRLESIKLAERYAFGGLEALSSSKMATRQNLFGYLEDTMRNAYTSANWREAITARTLGYIHQQDLHGPDALTTNNQKVEIKSESTFSLKRSGKIKKLSGLGSLCHYNDINDLKRLEGQKFVVCGFHNGMFLYAISFSYDKRFDSILRDKILIKTKKTVLKFSTLDWKDQDDLTLMYFNSNFKALNINSLDEIVSPSLHIILSDLINKT